MYSFGRLKAYSVPAAAKSGPKSDKAEGTMDATTDLHNMSPVDQVSFRLGIALGQFRSPSEPRKEFVARLRQCVESFNFSVDGEVIFTEDTTGRIAHFDIVVIDNERRKHELKIR